MKVVYGPNIAELMEDVIAKSKAAGRRIEKIQLTADEWVELCVVRPEIMKDPRTEGWTPRRNFASCYFNDVYVVAS